MQKHRETVIQHRVLLHTLFSNCYHHIIPEKQHSESLPPFTQMNPQEQKRPTPQRRRSPSLVSEIPYIFISEADIYITVSKCCINLEAGNDEEGLGQTPHNKGTNSGAVCFGIIVVDSR